MLLKFWKNKKVNKLENSFNEINKNLTRIQKYQKNLSFDNVENFLKENFEQSSEQISRVSRMQYKNHQDVLKNIALIQNRLEDLSNVFIAGNESLSMAALENKIGILISGDMQCIDNIDILLRGQSELEQEWKNSLMGMQNTLLDGLQKVGIKEIKLLGTAFNPFFAESIGTVSPSELRDSDKVYQAYEIVDIFKRGFISDDGRVIRKAQVLTISERPKENEENID